MKNFFLAVAAVALLTVATTSAQARRYHATPSEAITCNQQGCSDYYKYAAPQAEQRQARKVGSRMIVIPVRMTITPRHKNRAQARRNHREPGMMVGEERERPQARNYESEGLQPHPAGCPGRAFCGCGVSVKVFGHPVRDLYLAANWYRFARARAAAGMVAIFGQHHVAYIITAHGDGTATLYDPNSGGHATRIHRRSIARATIVDPNGNAAYSTRTIRHHRHYAQR